MKNFKRIMCLVLALVMVISALSISAFAAAYTFTGVEDSGSVNVKYEVSQVPKASFYNATTETVDNTYTAVGNNIYAVTVYAKSTNGIAFFQVPIQYREDHYAPMMTIDSGSLYVGYDTWFGDTTIKQSDFYKLPAQFSDTNMYLATGVVTTSKLSAKTYGLANTNAGSVAVQAEFVSPDDTANHTAWTAGLNSNVGTMFICLDDSSGTAKTAYLGTVNGLHSNDYVKMITVYFQRLDSVTEAQCIGDTFGINNATSYGVEISTKATTEAGYATTHAMGAQAINIINADVAAAVKPLSLLTSSNALPQQILFHKNVAGTAIESMDYRFVSQFSTSMFNVVYNATTGVVTSTNIAQVGMLLANTTAAKTYTDFTAYDTAAELATLNASSGDIRKVVSTKVSTTAAGSSNYAFSTRINGILASSIQEYNGVAYVLTTGGTVYFYPTLSTSNVQARYTTYGPTFMG